METHEDGDGETASRKPKRPLTAYNIFFKDKRQEILRRGSSGGFAALARNIAGMWKLVSPETKAQYLSRAAEDKQRYQREMAQWQGVAVSSSPTKKNTPNRQKKRAMQIPRCSPHASMDRSPSVDDGNDALELHQQRKEGHSLFDSEGSRSMHQNQETWPPSLGADDFPKSDVQLQQQQIQHNQQQQMQHNEQQQMQQQLRLDEAQLLRRVEANSIIDRRLIELRRQQPMSSGVGIEASLDWVLNQQQMRQRQEEQMIARAMQSRRHHSFDLAERGAANGRSMATTMTQQRQTYPSIPLSIQRNDSLLQRPMSHTQQHQDQSSIFTPNSLRRVFDSDLDNVAALPPAEDERAEEEFPSFDEETTRLMARMMDQEPDADGDKRGPQKDR